MQENERTLSALRQGLNYDYASPPLTSIEQKLPYLAQDRSMARLLSFDARLAAKQGKWTDAISDCLDCFALSNKLQTRGPIIGTYVSIAIRSIGRPIFWLAVNHLNSNQCIAEVRRVEQLEAEETPLSEQLMLEEAAGEAMVKEMCESPDAIATSSSSKSTWQQRLELNFLFTFRPKRASYELYRKHMKQASEMTNQPYAVAQKFVKIPHPPDLILLVEPDLSKALFWEARDQAFDRLLLTSMALRAYELDHAGKYPDSLGELVPNYLNAVPLDPFANGIGVPLVYRQKGSGYLLYSVGPDGVDDGGRPLESKDSYGRLTPDLCGSDDKGDLVAGINRE